jgi:hypothetical protein
MNLQKLHEDGIISKDTLDWLLPLWQQELEDNERLREVQTNNPFFDIDDQGDTFTKETIQNLEGITFSFWMDVASTGHGNHVWHSSIAMCIYLKKHYLSKRYKPGSSSLANQKSLELGAGTALPSLFLSHLLASQIDSPLSHQRPLVHITDGKQYRNIRQILFSLSTQPTHIIKNVSSRVSPHNWGECFDDETWMEKSNQGHTEHVHSNCYDLVLVSDCIYNPLFHGDLLKTIAANLRLPHAMTDDDGGGKAVLSFSLHGNTPDQDIWNFIDHSIKEIRHGSWRLTVRPIAMPWQHAKNRQQPVEGRYGWDMEDTMRQLGMWTARIEPKRWFSYLYEISWATVVQ